MLELPIGDDFHCHVRQGDMMKVVVPKILEGGIRRCSSALCWRHSLPSPLSLLSSRMMSIEEC